MQMGESWYVGDEVMVVCKPYFLHGGQHAVLLKREFQKVPARLAWDEAGYKLRYTTSRRYAACGAPVKVSSV